LKAADLFKKSTKYQKYYKIFITKKLCEKYGIRTNKNEAIPKSKYNKLIIPPMLNIKCFPFKYTSVLKKLIYYV